MEEIKYWDSRQFAHHPLVREGNKFWVVNYVQLTVNSEQESFIRAFIILVTNWPQYVGTPGPHLYLVTPLHPDDDVVGDAQGVECLGHPHGQRQGPRLCLRPPDHEAPQRLVSQHSHRYVPVNMLIYEILWKALMYSFIELIVCASRIFDENN